MSGYKQRTDAERDAIDERARNWQRPPSPTQREALQLLAKEPFIYSAAGWHPASNHGVTKFSTVTMTALAGRGLVKFKNRGQPRKATIAITPAGREALQKEPA